MEHLGAVSDEVATQTDESLEQISQIEIMGDRTLIRQFSAEQTTASGLIIPDKAQEAPLGGEVVAVGQGILLPELGSRAVSPFKVGDHVAFSKFAGMPFPFAGETFLLVRDDEIIARTKRGGE